MQVRPPASTELESLLDRAADEVTLAMLMERLGDRSFGIVLLVLGLLALLPGISVASAILLFVPAAQMIAGRSAPAFPRRLGGRRLNMQHLAPLIRRIAPALRWLERFIRPRWITPFQATKRVIGALVMVLGVCLLIPLPLSNYPPALLIILIASAYLEQDGVLLCAALAASMVLVAALALLAWEGMAAAGWIAGLI